MSEKLHLASRKLNELQDKALLAFSGRLGKLTHGFRVQNSSGQPAAIYWSNLFPGNAIEIAVAPNRLSTAYDAETILAWLELVQRENPNRCNVHKEGSGWPTLGFNYLDAIRFLEECRLLRRGLMRPARLQQIQNLLKSRGSNEVMVAKLREQYEKLRPTQHYAVIDLVRRAGISVKCWHERIDGIAVLSPRSNPAFRSNWAFGGKGEPSLASMWHASIKIMDGYLCFTGSFRADALSRELVASDRNLPDEQRHRARIQASRARNLDDLVRDVGVGGQLRVVINEGVMRDDSEVGLDSSYVKVRHLDELAWTVHHYNEVSGAYVLRRTGEALAQKPVPNANENFTDQHDLHGSDTPLLSNTTSKAYARDARVRHEVLERAQGHCEFCDVEGFKTIDGRLYLETHHVVPLSDCGVDRVWNVIALCPQHHREAHHGFCRTRLQEDFIRLLKDIYGNDINFTMPIVLRNP